MRSRFLLALAVAAQLVAPGIGRAGVEWVCAKDNAVHRSCCCEEGMVAGRRCAKLEAPDCCQLRAAADGQATRAGDTPSPAPLQISRTIAVVPVALAVAGGPCSAAPLRGATGPPIFLRNCSLLR